METSEGMYRKMGANFRGRNIEERALYSLTYWGRINRVKKGGKEMLRQSFLMSV